MNRWKKFVGITVLCVVVTGSGVFLFRSSRVDVRKKPEISLKLLEGKDNIVPFLVLGSGPASLSAALYGSRSGIKTFVLRGNQPGGQLTGTSYIENWPAIRKIRGIEVMNDFEDQVSRFGTVMMSDSAASIDFSSWPYKVITEEGHELYAMSLMIGTGAAPRRLNIPGEGEYWGKGVTTCAICDAPYHRGDKVVVIGGGDSAMEEALELSPYAKEVHVLVRSDKLRASVSMIEQVKACVNVTVHFNKALTQIRGDGKHVMGVMVQDTATKEESEWADTRGVFLAIGHVPNTKLFKGYVDENEAGYIRLDGRGQMTNWPGVVAAGDVSDPEYRQAGVAAGDGIKAGLDVVWWLASIGYNNYVQTKLEAFFFDQKTIQKKKLEEITSVGEYNEFMKHVTESVVVLDFFTPYCPSCMHMLPIIEWAAAKMSNKIKFCKVDASIAYDLVKKFKVPDVPHMVIIKDGQVVDRLKETMPRAEFYEYLKKFLS